MVIDSMTQDKEGFSLSEDIIPNNTITFYIQDEERIKICEDGAFLVNGKEVKKDIELYHAFVDFFKEYKEVKNESE